MICYATITWLRLVLWEENVSVCLLLVVNFNIIIVSYIGYWCIELMSKMLLLKMCKNKYDTLLFAKRG